MFKSKLVKEYLDVFMVKNMKNSKEFYQFMLQDIVDLNNNAEYHNYNKFIIDFHQKY